MTSKSNIYDITTIKLERETKSRLDKLKIHKRETYNEIIQKILSILNICKVNPFQARSKLDEIDRMRRNIKLNNITKTSF